MEEFRQELRELQRRVHDNALDKGFHSDLALMRRLYADGSINDAEREELYLAMLGKRVALIGSEASELLEELRASAINTPKFKTAGPFGLELEGSAWGNELADIVIRCLDFAEATGVDLAKEIEAKVAFNAQRPKKHGGKNF